MILSCLLYQQSPQSNEAKTSMNERRINDPIITVGDIPTFDLTLSTTNTTIRKKICKDTENLNNTTINQPDLNKMHRI